MPQPHKEYSTSLPKKLGIKEGARVALINSPTDPARLLGPLPGVEIKIQARGTFDVIVLFATKISEVTKRFPTLARALEPNGRLWVAYPKKASGVTTDLTFDNVQRTGLDAGLVDNKSIAVDDTFSGVQFVYRLKDRPK
ncbi:MAG TPA: DUF3052 domain-containing protein [Actinomycetota bacterium]|nr:DUF3052 domain-containing protein [Actinomycetota bacterium]